MHELYMKNRQEIELYKILKKISEVKNLTLKKEKEGFYLHKDYIRVYKRNKTKVNDKIIHINNLYNYLTE